MFFNLVIRYERQQKDAEEKMLQHWRINNPEFRELQFKTRQVCSSEHYSFSFFGKQ